MGAFDSAWMKWVWALRHLQDLKTENDAWARTGSLTEHVRFDAAANELVLSFTGVTPPPPGMSLHLADAMGAFRQSLDHCARVMVDRGSSPGKKSYFVLRAKEEDFASGMNKDMNGVDTDDYDLVHDLNKTYIWGGTKPANTPIILMRDLNNHDKHNALALVAAMPANARIDGTYTDCTKTGAWYPTATGELADGAEIARVAVNPTGANPAMTMTGTVSADARINGFDIADLANHVARTIHDEVLVKLQPTPPPEIHRLGVQLTPAPQARP